MKNVMQLVKTELDDINSNLSDLFTNSNEIFFELNFFLKSPKKRIRSLVTILYIKAFSKQINTDLLTVCELIHNASLLHDDVIDNADFRRNNPTFNKKFNSHISILSGDYLLSLATDKLIQIGNWNIIKNFQSCIQQMSEAELLQYSLRGNIPTKNEYLKIAKGKTAELFIATLKSSAELADLNLQQAEYFAENFGILFQIKNDFEINSEEADKKNGIHTLKDIIGIEKTKSLMDNYLEEIRSKIGCLPQNKYSKGLEELLRLI